ncbi:MAG: DUF459 domain-containing protein [Actinomycetota bacterium]|nr:DUF459 domain-containing protein [Actinomycetota bacterium]
MTTSTPPERPRSEPRTLRYHASGTTTPMAAGQIVIVGLIAFGLAGLFNAESLYATARRQPYGWKRTVALDVVGPVRAFSRFTRLSAPRAKIETAIGRDPEAGTRSVSRVVTVTTLAPDAPPPTVKAIRPTAQHRVRLWVGGDSMAQEFGTSMIEKAEGRGTLTATLDYHVSTGLTRPDYFDWPAYLRDKVLPTKPDALVLMFGANDAQAMEVDGKPYKVRTPEWQAEYRKRVGLVMDLLSGQGRLVMWVGTPHMRSAEFDERQMILNGIYREEAAKRPWVHFVDSGPVLSPPGGGYAAYLPGGDGQPEIARASDGIHLSRFGADRLADAVFLAFDAVLAKADAGPAAPAATPPTSSGAAKPVPPTP